MAAIGGQVGFGIDLGQKDVPILGYQFGGCRIHAGNRGNQRSDIGFGCPIETGMVGKKSGQGVWISWIGLEIFRQGVDKNFIGIAVRVGIFDAGPLAGVYRS